MKGYVKVRRKENLKARLRQLDSTSVPLPFKGVYAAIVEDAQFVERQIHDAFDDHRVRSNREFFRIAHERVVAALRLANIIDATARYEVGTAGDTLLKRSRPD